MKRIASTVLFALCLAVAAPAVVAASTEPAPASAAAAQVAKININSASAKELQSLPGIGQVTAERIVAYRTEKGKFKSTNDLLKVKGIGKKSLEKIRDLIMVE
jgi:competence protein ComEA